MTPDAAIERLRQDFAARRPIRSGSLIVTVFGDAIAPRGGGALLGGLLRLLAGFGLNESQVRTALSRLVAEGWLASTRVGRRSAYSLTEAGQHRVAEASRRIYHGAPAAVRDGWRLAILPPLAPDRREAWQRALGWLGFGTVAPTVLLHPDPDAASLASLLADMPAAERPVLLAASDSAGSGGWAPIVARAWDWAALAHGYGTVTATFAPVAAHLSGPPDPEAALQLRLMLIHDLRRVVLHDPLLPAALAPAGWPGDGAFALAGRIYRAVAPAAEQWLDRHLARADGPLPVNATLGERFAICHGKSG